MIKLKNAVLGASLVLCAGAATAFAQNEQRHVAGDLVISGELCGTMKWYWPDKNFPGSKFSWEIEGCNALDGLLSGNPPTPTPTPTPDPDPPTPPNDQGDCPAGAQWLDYPIPGNENGVAGLSAVVFGPNESKYFCSRLPSELGNAKKLKYGFSGRDNDHTCESMMIEVVSVPAESTTDRSRLATNEDGYRSAGVDVAFYVRDADVAMDAPPGLYVIKATELFGERDPGQQVCRTFQIYKDITYP